MDKKAEIKPYGQVTVYDQQRNSAFIEPATQLLALKGGEVIEGEFVGNGTHQVVSPSHYQRDVTLPDTRQAYREPTQTIYNTMHDEVHKHNTTIVTMTEKKVMVFDTTAAMMVACASVACIVLVGLVLDVLRLTFSPRLDVRPVMERRL